MFKSPFGKVLGCWNEWYDYGSMTVLHCSQCFPCLLIMFIDNEGMIHYIMDVDSENMTDVREIHQHSFIRDA